MGNSGWYAVAEARHERGDQAGAEGVLERIAAAGDTRALLTIAKWRSESDDPPGAEAALYRAIDSGASGAKQLLAQWKQRAPHRSSDVG